jgi:hypothetical protein
MLGVAQDVLGIVKNIPFKELGVEFHIYGGGKQLDDIKWLDSEKKELLAGFIEYLRTRKK